MGIKIKRPSDEVGPVPPNAVMALKLYADQLCVNRTSSSKTSRRKSENYVKLRHVLQGSLLNGLTQGGDTYDLR